MSAACTSSKKWCQRFAAASPVYELYAPRGLRWRAALRGLVSAVVVIVTLGRMHGQTLVFPDFTSVPGLQLNGNAEVLGTGIGSGTLRLAPRAANQAGSVFTSTALDITEFSTVFQFRMPSVGGDQDDTGRRGGDGFAFVIQTAGPDALGEQSSGLGFAGLGPQSVAIEFDTFRNAQVAIDDPSSNHIGFNVSGSVVSLLTYSTGPDENFDDGETWTAWIDYDGSTLEVRVSSNGVRPTAPQLVKTNLLLSSASLLDSPSAFVGFTAATGSALNNHDLLNWSFSNTFVPGGFAAVPEPSTLVLAGLGLLLLLARRRSKMA